MENEKHWVDTLSDIEASEAARCQRISLANDRIFKALYELCNIAVAHYNERHKQQFASHAARISHSDEPSKRILKVAKITDDPADVVLTFPIDDGAMNYQKHGSANGSGTAEIRMTDADTDLMFGIDEDEFSPEKFVQLLLADVLFSKDTLSRHSDPSIVAEVWS